MVSRLFVEEGYGGASGWDPNGFSDKREGTNFLRRFEMESCSQKGREVDCSLLGYRKKRL